MGKINTSFLSHPMLFHRIWARKMRNLLLVLGVNFFLGSCSAGMDYQRVISSLVKSDLITTGRDYQEVLDSWLGYDINLLVRRWGSPTDSFQARNGNIVHFFGRTDTRNTPQRVYKHISTALPDAAYATTFKSKIGFSALPEYMSLFRNGPVGDEVKLFACETLFEVSRENLIIHWSYRGYDCY